jgi:hypothetical protein
VPGHKKHTLFVRAIRPTRGRISAEYKNIIEAEGEFKKVPLDLRVSNKIVYIGAEASHEKQMKLLSFLDKNSDAFAWSTFDLLGVSRDVIEHRLHVSPSVR